MSLLRVSDVPFVDLNPGMAALEDSEGLFTHLETKKMIAEKYAARHFSGTQQTLEENEVDNAYWAPEAENPADGLTNVRRDMGPSCVFWSPATLIQVHCDH